MFSIHLNYIIMKNLFLAVLAVLASASGFAQTPTKTRDTLITGKKMDTTLTNRDKKNTVKEAIKTSDYTKVTRQEGVTKDTTTTKRKKRTTR
ncbi:hypothetical protein J2X31_003321 [Flavobacterium arsenatis]|uniref:Uncharacterized protein n=1 Tax=Flavobacterium arsenatis TaxID=1484332 RepID=A0ABU1TTX3_9FLAO|nr:hypothetical protein [Flavobacterium arsenatis]MDR6969291.1 hypothetical protein [Flavobacterium arsenatis]